MRIITDLAPQVKNKNRLNLYINEEFACGISRETAAIFRLSIGKELSADFYQTVLEEEEKKCAWEAALAMISARNQSAARIKQKLERKEFSPGAVLAAVEKLKGYGYLNDEAFAQRFLTAYPLAGRLLLLQKMRQQGIAAPQAEQALTALSYEDELARAQECARLFKEKSKLSGPELQKKLAAHLAARGFSWDIASGVL